MTSLTCPKCRHGLTDEAIDAEQCPLCGFPLLGPVVLASPGSRVSGMWLVLLAATLLLAVGGAIFVLSDRTSRFREPNQDEPQALAQRATELPPEPVTHVAPAPHEPKRPEAIGTPSPPNAPGIDDKGQPPVPVPFEPPRRVGPRPVGVVMKVDPKIAPKRQFDHPDDTAALPDLNTGDHVVLTGRLRVLRLGAINGRGILDASGLVAEEVIITGDLSGEAQVQLSAPHGTVTVGGYVTGSSKLTIAAPGGTVTVAGSGRMSGGPIVTVTAKRLEVKCPMSGAARVQLTLTTGGSLKLGLMEEGATVLYRKGLPNDPQPKVEKGEIRGGAKVLGGD
jgi:hypothetical protein